MEENKDRLVSREYLKWAWVEVSNRVVREGHIDKVAFDQRHERSEVMNQADIWKNIPNRGISEFKDFWVESMPRLL